MLGLFATQQISVNNEEVGNWVDSDLPESIRTYGTWPKFYCSWFKEQCFNRSTFYDDL